MATDPEWPDVFHNPLVARRCVDLEVAEATDALVVVEQLDALQAGKWFTFGHETPRRSPLPTR